MIRADPIARIKSGINAGCITVLVMSGETDEKTLADSECYRFIRQFFVQKVPAEKEINPFQQVFSDYLSHTVASREIIYNFR